MALFIARMGTTASASHQIAANLAAVLYMIPLSIGIATSARTSYWLGAADAHRARKAVRLGFLLGDTNGSRNVTLSDQLSVDAVLARTEVLALRIGNKAYEVKCERGGGEMHLWVGSARFAAEARDSLDAQRSIEAADNTDFDTYLAHYVAD